MYREYDKTLDSNGAMRSVHVTIKELLVTASDLLKQEQYEELAAIYDRISVLGSSLRESAEVRHNQQEEKICSMVSHNPANEEQSRIQGFIFEALHTAWRNHP